MTTPLDYHKPGPARPVSTPVWALLVSAGMHAIVWVLYGGALDGGQSDLISAAVSLAYWAITLFILFRRWRRLTEIDHWFIAIGYPLMLLVTVSILGVISHTYKRL